MEIHKELNQIASADYGLQLKDPIFAAYSKLITDPKFELVQNILVDDYAEFEETLRKFNINNALNKTIRNFLDLLVILNGRKGFIAKTGSAHPQGDATYNIAYWIDMLGKELINSGTGVYTDGVDERGSGVVNGSRMRAAMYHILDILQYKYSEFRDYQIVTFESPCCIIGRDMYDIGITATSEDIGYLNPDDNKYYVDVKVKNLWRFKDEQTITIEIGDEPLHKGSFIHKECSPSMPFSLYSISIDSFEGELTLSYYQIREEEITPGAIKIKTGILPLTFYTVDTSLLDWYLRGSVNGVGKLGKNLLKQTTDPIPNGAVGTFIEANTDGWFNGSQNIANGYSFNTKTAKRIVLAFAKSDESALSVSDVGNLMLVEGTTVPAAYDADTNLYKKNIMWGGLYPHTYKPYPETYSEDDAQELYAGDNGYGGEVLYRFTRSFLETRCKTYVIDVEPNTDYSVRLFGSSVTLMSYIYLLDEPGTVQQTFMGADMQGGGACAIPSCGEYVTNTEQWCRLDAIMATGYPSTNDVAVDARPNKYEFCESFAELEAGTYKLMVEVLGNHTWNGSYVGFTFYGGNIYDSFTPSGTYPPAGTYERFALVAEDDTLVIPETNIFDSTTVRYSTSPPYPNFHHKEYTFTLTKKTKVGVIHRGYSNVHNYSGGDADIQAYFRFMICKETVEPVEFESTNLYANISGESAWEPYKYTLPLTITNVPESPDEPILSKRVDLDLGDKPLGPNDTIHMTDVDLPIPTFEGWNTLDCLSDTLDKPYAYIRYQQ